MSAQAMEALSTATRIREGERSVKNELKAGSMSLIDALEHPGAQSAVVWELLRSLPGWSDALINDLAGRLVYLGVPIGPRTRVRALSARQRRYLVGGVEEPSLGKGLIVV